MLRRRRDGRGHARVGLAALGVVLVLALVWGPLDAPAADSEQTQGPAPTSASTRMPAAAAAEGGWAYDLAGELMSPFCPGRTLASCPSPNASELIQWIALQEAAGATREEVVAQLVARHGEEILGAPPARGITLWAYVLPVLGFVGFGVIAFVVLRRIVGGEGGPLAVAGRGVEPSAAASAGPSRAPAASGPASPTSGPAARDELARIIDAELAERA